MTLEEHINFFEDNSGRYGVEAISLSFYEVWL